MVANSTLCLGNITYDLIVGVEGCEKARYLCHEGDGLFRLVMDEGKGISLLGFEWGRKIEGARLLTSEAGGGGVNTATATRRIVGGPVYVLGAIGGGSFGREVERHLSVNGIKADMLARREDPCLSVVLTDEFGQSTTIPIRTPSLRAQELVPLNNLVGFRRVLMSHMGAEVTAAALQKIALASVILGWGPGKPELEALESGALELPGEFAGKAVASMNESEWTSIPSAQDRMLRLFDVIVVTRGANGSRIYADKKDAPIGICAAPNKDEVASTSGAGDSFLAAFTLALDKGLSPRDAARFASVIAARATESITATGGLPPRCGSYPTPAKMRELIEMFYYE